MLRTAALLVLLMALPAAAVEVPMPPQRPDAAAGQGPETVVAPRIAKRPVPAASTGHAPMAAAIPARRMLPGDDGDSRVGGSVTGRAPSPAAPAAPIAKTPGRTEPVPVARPIPAGDPTPRSLPRKSVEPAPAATKHRSAPPVPPVKPAAHKARTAMVGRTVPEGPRKHPSGGRIVCGDPRLVGRIKPTVTGRHPGCLITDAVEVTSIAGIRLSMPATLACSTARTFANWMTGVADPAARKMLGGRIDRIWVMGSFACRTRNSLRGTRLSEHSVGRAMDVGGFTLGDGRKIRVKKDWGRGKAGKFLRHIWKRACGMFKTVLGPDGDRYHRDHLHVDVALRRSAYCR